jgi:enterochelin esterase-like enzyme
MIPVIPVIRWRSVGRRAALGLFAAIVCVGHAAAQQVAGGQLVTDTLHSVALEHNLYHNSPNRPVLVYLPPSYATSIAKRYPVVYLLHGFGTDNEFWLTVGHIKATMDSLVSAGAVREMIVVMPNANNVFGGAFYTNSATTGNWDDFIAKELVGFIDGKYRTLARPQSRGLGGHSMGGYGTFAVGMRHAGDIYGSLYAMSACCTQVRRDPGRSTLWDSVAAVRSVAEGMRLPFIPKAVLAMTAAFSPDPSAPPLFVTFPFVRRDGHLVPNEPAFARWVENAPLDMIPSHAAALKQLHGVMFDVGMSDQIVPPGSLMAIDSALTRAGVTHTFETYDGDHANRVGLRVATRVLPFFSRTLDFGEVRTP